MFCLAVSATEAKWLLKTLAISQRLEIAFSPRESALGAVDNTFFIVTIDLIPSQVFFELFRLELKYIFIVILFTSFEKA